MTIEEEKIRIGQLNTEFELLKLRMISIEAELYGLRRPKFVDAKQVLADLDVREKARHKQVTKKVEPIKEVRKEISIEGNLYRLVDNDS